MDHRAVAPRMTSMQSLMAGWPLLFIVFLGSSLFGVANIIWKGEEVGRLRMIAAAVMCGSAGLIVCLLLWDRYHENNVALLAGISLLAGIGGATTIDVAIGALKKKLSK